VVTNFLEQKTPKKQKEKKKREENIKESGLHIWLLGLDFSTELNISIFFLFFFQETWSH
jgi:hypothetical protein